MDLSLATKRELELVDQLHRILTGGDPTDDSKYEKEELLMAIRQGLALAAQEKAISQSVQPADGGGIMPLSASQETLVEIGPLKAQKDANGNYATLTQLPVWLPQGREIDGVIGFKGSKKVGEMAIVTASQANQMQEMGYKCRLSKGAAYRVGEKIRWICEMEPTDIYVRLSLPTTGSGATEAKAIEYAMRLYMAVRNVPEDKQPNGL
jgi:hypothetical protein